jgi:hypothetical protein
MSDIFLIFAIIAIVAFIVFIVRNRFADNSSSNEMTEQWRQLLDYNISYYHRLNDKGKQLFEEKVVQFLNRVKIKGVGTAVNDTDKILIASSAIIPVFAFPDWEYTVLDEVLIYPDNFNEQFLTTGPNRYYRGLVGFGHLERKLLISRTALYEGFDDFTDKRNTCLHEFIHLIDKEDDQIDGIPERLLEYKYVIPWMLLMKREMQRINQGLSDIHPYATKNTGEFLAVVSEYFFERPDDFEIEHPELFSVMSVMFRQPLPKPRH